MKGYCVIVTKGSEHFIYNVFLVDSKKDVHPVEAIKEHSRKLATLPWPVDYWDDHEKDIEWFVVSNVEKLRAIKWPAARNDGEAESRHKAVIQVCRAFEIPQVNYKQALEALENPVITRALSLGWSPRGVRDALHDLAWAMEKKDQAEAYRDEVMDMIDDIQKAVDATESIYQQDADNFLEEEGAESNPYDPKNMTIDKLIEEATQLHGVIYVSDCFGVPDMIRLREIEIELFSRGYEVRADTGYSVQKREEE